MSIDFVVPVLCTLCGHSNHGKYPCLVDGCSNCEGEIVAIQLGTFRCELCDPPVLLKYEHRPFHMKMVHKVIGNG